MIEIDPATLEWRELFARSVGAELNSNRTLLLEIRELCKTQNERIRANEIAIASLKTWVVIVGGLTGIGGLISAMLWVLQ